MLGDYQLIVKFWLLKSQRVKLMVLLTLVKARGKMPKERTHSEVCRNVLPIQLGITLGKNSPLWAAGECVQAKASLFHIDPRNPSICALEIFLGNEIVGLDLIPASWWYEFHFSCYWNRWDERICLQWDWFNRGSSGKT